MAVATPENNKAQSLITKELILKAPNLNNRFSLSISHTKVLCVNAMQQAQLLFKIWFALLFWASGGQMYFKHN